MSLAAALARLRCHVRLSACACFFRHLARLREPVQLQLHRSHFSPVPPDALVVYCRCAPASLWGAISWHLLGTEPSTGLDCRLSLSPPLLCAVLADELHLRCAASSCCALYSLTPALSSACDDHVAHSLKNNKINIKQNRKGMACGLLGMRAGSGQQSYSY